jgi:hypothetical protein
MDLTIILLMLSLFAFFINLPMGMWRSKMAKYSWRWFLAIHLSIPIIFYIRTEAEISVMFIPIIIFAAVVGQLAGGRIQNYYDCIRSTSTTK